ncbi:MAG: glycosyltransferase family 4 protein [Parabacteroides sp.]|nr:glycosyltransferase family 4 protein [bacterium]MDY4102052.1 glycosyltransferase family 4 protein [Parabacteroides sp.]
MKVVILNTSEHTGGAAVAANRLLKALRKQSVEAHMLVRDKSSQDPDVATVNRTWLQQKANLLRFLWERLVIFLCNHFSRTTLFQVSIANTGTDLSQHPLVQAADVIHLHWINQGFLSLHDLQKLVSLGKPIVWTMHDMWPCTGICHHARECERFRQQCGQCFYLTSHQKDLSTRVFRSKNRIYQNAPLTFVGCSQWLTNRAKQSRLFIGKQILSIPNPIDLQRFKPMERKAMREQWKLPLDKKLILFGALNVTNERKGLSYLIKALHILSSDQIALVVFGQVKSQVAERIPVAIHSLGYVSDEEKVATIYNAVDLFVTSSLEENLPNTIMESMACGTPCVGFNTGGIPEMIDHLSNGYVARYQDSADLARGIEWVLNHPEPAKLRETCIQKVKEHYSEEVIAGKYLSLYEQIKR